MELTYWNNAKKIVKELTVKLPKVKIVFSELITRKEKKNLDRNVTKTNKRLRNHCITVVKIY